MPIGALISSSLSLEIKEKVRILGPMSSLLCNFGPAECGKDSKSEKVALMEGELSNSPLKYKEARSGSIIPRETYCHEQTQPYS